MESDDNISDLDYYFQSSGEWDTERLLDLYLRTLVVIWSVLHFKSLPEGCMCLSTVELATAYHERFRGEWVDRINYGHMRDQLTAAEETQEHAEKGDTMRVFKMNYQGRAETIFKGMVSSPPLLELRDRYVASTGHPRYNKSR